MSLKDNLAKAVHKHAEKHRSASKDKGKKKTVHSMNIERTDNGGHTVTHRMEQGPGEHYKEPEIHVFTSDSKMLKHVKEHMCTGGAAEEESK